MCSKAGIDGDKTNHSLKATGVTHMFEGNVTEKIIQECTGHCNVEALCTYQQTSVVQQKAVPSLLSVPSQTNFLDLCTPKSSVVLTRTGSAPKSSVNLTPTGSMNLFQLHQPLDLIVFKDDCYFLWL